jgi:hypothetical protein
MLVGYPLLTVTQSYNKGDGEAQAKVEELI